MPAPVRTFVGLSIIAIAALVPVVAGTPAAVSATTSTVSGRVFNDFDVNGTQRLTDDTTNFLKAEPGVAGVVVRAFDSTGALVGTATTASNGDYTLTTTNATTTAVRVEFTVPDGYEPSFAAAAGSSVQFVTLPATGVTLGIQIPADHCQGKPLIAGVCMVAGSRQVSGPTIRTEPFYAPTHSFNNIARNEGVSGTGGTWGLALHRPTRQVWTSAFVRRTVSLGPEGLGGLYVFRSSTAEANTPEQVASFDLTAEKGLTFGPPGVDFSDAARGLTTGTGGPTAPYSTDTAVANDSIGFEWVGRAGIGDIDMTDDGTALFVVNLYQRAVHRIEVGGTASVPTLGAVTTWGLDDAGSCQTSGSIARPFGIDVQEDGTVLVGVACAELTDTPAYTGYAEGVAVVSLDPTATAAGAWSLVLRSPLSYSRLLENCTYNRTGSNERPCSARWMAWTNNADAVVAVVSPSARYGLNRETSRWPQPMLTDLEVLRDGSIVIAVNDRLSYQFADRDLLPNTNKTNIVEAYTSGDSRLFCKVNGTYHEESGGNCGPSGSVAYTGAKNWVYWQDEFFYDQLGDRHRENMIGAVALAPKNSTQPDQLAFTVMDSQTTFVNGVSWNRLSNGAQITASDFITDRNFPGFGKSSGMGDIEVLCDPAPVQIGDRVWRDTDGDGIQDAGEPGVAGVTVRLYDAAGALVSTAVTDVNGQYRFSSTVTEAAAGESATPDASGGNVQFNTAYTIRFDDPDDYASGGPLDGLGVTRSAQVTSVATDQESLIDSDATVVASFPRISVPPLAPGANDHSFDVGFTTPRVSVGDRVWLDVDRDGVQDQGELGLPGVTVTITNADGSAVTDINGNTVTSAVTDADGEYSFDDLPAGQYRVTVVPPAGYVATKPAQVTSVALSGVARDDTLDVGLDPSQVTVGGAVWADADGDGVLDAGEVGTSGVTMSITNMDGSAVTDVYGNPVPAVMTDANGEYEFAKLPPGQYRVTVSPPAGADPSGSNAVAGTAVSVNLTADGAADTSIRFGYVPAGSGSSGSGGSGGGAGSSAAGGAGSSGAGSGESSGSGGSTGSSGAGTSSGSTSDSTMSGATVAVSGVVMVAGDPAAGTVARPLAGALVTVGALVPVTTGSDGSFTVSGVPAGTTPAVSVIPPFGVDPATVSVSFSGGSCDACAVTVRDPMLPSTGSAGVPAFLVLLLALGGLGVLTGRGRQISG